MKKKLWFLPFIILIVTLFAGCGGSSPPADYPETRQKAAQLVSTFESAVESYDVDAMLGCLSNPDFNLTIQEAGHSVSKSYSTLESELWLDEPNQRAWRHQPGTDPNGHGYVLNLVLGTLDCYSTTASGTNANQTFEVWESSAEITPPIKTDKGTFKWTIVEDSGVWKAVEMTIQYKALSASGITVMQVKNISKGFGFTSLKL